MPALTQPERKAWARDIFLIPLIVGVLLAILTFVLPLIFGKKKELSYSLDGPTPLLSELLQPVNVQINGERVSALYGYGVRLWSSGNDSIETLPVLVSFDSNQLNQSGQPNFKIYHVWHKTRPAREFGKIQDDLARKREASLLATIAGIVSATFALGAKFVSDIKRTN